MLAGDAFNGHRVLENSVRLFTMLVGIPLALICVKFGIVAMRAQQKDRAWGTLSYGLIVLVPAIGRAMNFGNPVNWVTTGLYAAGLIAGIIGLYYRATVSAWWLRWRAKRSREDADD